MLLLDISLLQELWGFCTSLYNQTYMDTIKKKIVQLAHLKEKHYSPGQGRERVSKCYKALQIVYIFAHRLFTTLFKSAGILKNHKVIFVLPYN